jgi:hypothetical protein
MARDNSWNITAVSELDTVTTGSRSALYCTPLSYGAALNGVFWGLITPHYSRFVIHDIIHLSAG